MCCSLEKREARLVIQEVSYEEKVFPPSLKEKIYYLNGLVDRTPKNFGERANLFFQQMEYIEKIAEIADESFHLFASVLQTFASTVVYQALRNLHHASHNVEYILHSFCFFGDVSRLLSGRLLEYNDSKRTKINYLKSAGRLCHATAHFFATANLLAELEICRVSSLGKMIKFSPLFSVAGYALWTISLIWERFQKDNENFVSDLSIHLSGFLFEAIPYWQPIPFVGLHERFFNKFRASCGIFHAYQVSNRILPQNKEYVHGKFRMSVNGGLEVLKISGEDSDHNHVHNHAHAHGQAPIME